MNANPVSNVVPRRVRISLGGESRIVNADQAINVMDELNAKYGGQPTVEDVDTTATTLPAPVEPSASVPAPAVEPAPAAPVFSDWGNTVIDQDAKARIDAQQQALRDAGVTGIGFKGEGGDGYQAYANGTRMADIGYKNHGERYRAFLRDQDARDAAHGLSGMIKAEVRRDEVVSAREFADKIEVNGKITVFGLALSVQAIRGLLARLESPALSYVLGVRQRIENELLLPEEERNLPAMRADRAKIADVLRHECLRNHEVPLKLRTRRGLLDIFAIVSPTFAPADAPEALDPVVDALPEGCRGAFTYDPVTTAWTYRAYCWTPTPVDQQAVGEAFRGFVEYSARDNGTSKFRGGGGAEFLACLNASTYVSENAKTDRVHRGRVLLDVSLMTAEAMKSITALCKAWGVNRATEVAVPERLTIEDAIPGFWRYLLTDRRSELQGVLAGRSEKHIEQLTQRFHEERRVKDKLVRADLAQAWTRHSQEQPADIRQDATTAIGQWLVSGSAVRCDLRDRDVETI